MNAPTLVVQVYQGDRRHRANDERGGGEQLSRRMRNGYVALVKTYMFKCILTAEPRPAVHMDTCASDADAHQRALSLFDVWPLAVKADVQQEERRFEIARPE